MAGARNRADMKLVGNAGRQRKNARADRRETPMSSTEVEIRSEPRTVPSRFARAGRLGRGAVLAALLTAAVGLTAVPVTAEAGSNNGAAIGLGILGGVIAGTAIAAATTPAYPAPPAYYYPPQGYYYNEYPGYSYAPPPYYGAYGYGYPAYNYQ
jgi:hypothetical protein